MFPVIKLVKANEPCSPDFSKRGYETGNPYLQSVWWTLNSKNADQFWADLLTNTGIPKDKISFQGYGRGNECFGAPADNDCWGSNMDFDMPMPNDYVVKDVTYPKDTLYEGDGFELVDSVYVPVLMIAEAVNNMATVDSVADQIDAAHTEAIILSIFGTVWNSAMDVYTIVSDPSNAPLGIFDLVMVALALADCVQITKAAKIRRGMSDDDILKLGGRVSTRMKTIRKATGAYHEA